MKNTLKSFPILPTLIAGLGLLLADRATAQTFTVLHSFTNGSDGASPFCGLVLSGSTLYGVGGSSAGPVFAVNTDGTGFTNLHSFTGGTDGLRPMGGLLLSSNTLYGTTYLGGVGGGIVYAVNTDGSGFTNLYTFTPAFYPATNSDGAHSTTVLILSGNTLYGTATDGGNGLGTVFAVNTDGTGFTNLHSFTTPQTNSLLGTFTNFDGGFPYAGLILSGNTLYSTTYGYGGSGKGTVFAISTNGTSFKTLYSFSALVSTTNSDGANPLSNLILSGNMLYGTANSGGSFSRGTVFAIKTDGTGFTNLHNFTGGSEGGQPWAGLTLSGNTLYGVTSSGGISNNGTVFAISTNGSGFTNLYSFTGGSDGGVPNDQLVVSGNALYGTTRKGGAGYGTVFSLSFPIQLTIIPSGTNIVLTWSTNYAGFDCTGFTLQTTTNLVPSAVWTAVYPIPVIGNGQNAVTNPVSGNQQFYRLSQ